MFYMLNYKLVYYNASMYSPVEVYPQLSEKRERRTIWFVIISSTTAKQYGTDIEHWNKQRAP